VKRHASFLSQCIAVHFWQSFVNGMVGWADGSQHYILAPRIIIITIVIPSSFTLIVIIVMKISSVRSSPRLFQRSSSYVPFGAFLFMQDFFNLVFFFSLLIIPVGNADVDHPVTSCVLWFFISFLHCVHISRRVKDSDNCPRLSEIPSIAFCHNLIP